MNTVFIFEGLGRNGAEWSLEEFSPYTSFLSHGNVLSIQKLNKYAHFFQKINASGLDHKDYKIK